VETIDCAKLVPIKLTNLNQKNKIFFPLNSLFIDINDGIYTSEKLYRKMHSKSYPLVCEFLKIEQQEDANETDVVSSSHVFSNAQTSNNLHLKELRNEVSTIWNELNFSQFEVMKARKEAQIAKVFHLILII
jgi:hypothetical protein